MKRSSIGKAIASIAMIGIALTACGGNTGEDTAAVTEETTAATETAGETTEVLSVVAAYSSAIEEPWDGVIHEALQEMADAGEITYKYIDKIGYASGAFERALRQIAEEDKPAIIMGDSFGNEESARKVALDYPNIAFVMGSGGGPAEPNFSVFDNWIHEPAYVSGILAGSLTKSNVIGIVGGIPVPEVNRIVNAFIAGAQSVNPKVTAKINFINSWFDPAAAKEAADAANKTKGEFLANMSHEIRTPMNAILGLTELALRQPMTPKLGDYLGKVQLAAKNLLGIINDILDLSKVESGKMELEITDFNLDDVLDNL
ncbi:MAG: hypothetical protein RI976_1171, partial [Actinomycetota bacterium]